LFNWGRSKLNNQQAAAEKIEGTSYVTPPICRRTLVLYDPTTKLSGGRRVAVTWSELLGMAIYMLEDNILDVELIQAQDQHPGPANAGEKVSGGGRFESMKWWNP
jgi:hypothetical protein